jgi:HAD superfamily hydrolase (TIGR01450 family)
MNIRKIRIFLFDLDGVLSAGKEKPRYIGGRALVTKIKSLGRKAAVLTNDSTHTREELHQNLSKLGFSFDVNDILTSSYLTGLYLTQRFGKTGFHLIGEEGLRRELEEAGHYQTEEKPRVVVVGLDRELSYVKLDTALRFLRNGALLIGSYGGAVYMSDHGPALSAGPIIKALEYGAGKRAIMIGKPSPRMFQLALKRANEHPRNAVMIGDQLETDVVGARAAGVHTILVLTGVETRETIAESKLRPEMVVENIDDIIDLVQ